THVRAVPAHGLALLERRRRLKSTFTGMAGEDIARLVREHGRDHIMETYEHPLLCFSGDAMPVPVDDVRGADVLIHEATFINPDHRKDRVHATVEEALEVAVAAKVSCLVLSHFSSRYQFMNYKKAYIKLIERAGPDFPVYLAPFELQKRFQLTALWKGRDGLGDAEGSAKEVNDVHAAK
ncbi:hypothetical protein JYT83_01490, partial [bacterium AH-315-F18]|nr:hypothetical protein [bacterium AH-315-F18]